MDVLLQTRWRSKLAKRELRRRRAEARESGKLLQDKQALEHRLKEMQAILETVQNQRNELKQLYKVRPFLPVHTLHLSLARQQSYLFLVRAASAVSQRANLTGK